ncbi:hypothetical protein [Seleniivibrio sp.]|uniref:hypothetical protein n=1 Tax=Seleniivibrio sp. TaxID=2898801 RepID=UPI0025E6312E|nr:hypothetical protein [Seleniivibrio sp.]MCD8553349.1 hypothetical protein [Seleniivibrio sp.]
MTISIKESKLPEPVMYVNYNSKSAQLQYSASESKTDKAGTKTRSVDIRIDYKSVDMKAVDTSDTKTGNDSYVTDREAGNIEEYVRKSVSSIMDKIGRHSQNTLRAQADTVLANVHIMSVSIEISVHTETTDASDTANSLLGEDGYFGIEKTSQRLFEMAKALSGDDAEKLQEAKDAITKGYESVAGLFGESTPQITHDTYNKTMEKMDSYIDHLNRQVEKSYA